MGLCEHGEGCHAGLVDSSASAPEDARAWLLIEHQGPWAAEPLDSPGLPPVAMAASELGVRVQLIRRPGESGNRVFAAWTAGPSVWSGEFSGDLKALSRGHDDAIIRVGEPMYLVCTHGRRDMCCGRYGGALARALGSAGYPVWETSHVDGHRFAANLVILPHGLYYGPVDLPAAKAALSAYEDGRVLPDRFRGRAGIPAAEQAAEHMVISDEGSLVLPGVPLTTPCP